MKQKEQTKAITYKSNGDNTTISKEIYDEVLEESMNEILKMTREIDYSNLVYDFKGLTHILPYLEVQCILIIN